MKLNLLEILLILNFVITTICIIILIVYIIKHKKLSNKYKKLWSKFDNKNVEQDIEYLIEFMKQTQEYCENTEKSYIQLENKFNKCIQKTGFVKFNAYDSGNSGLSFSFAMLDNNDNGIILNNIYTRSGSNIYAKEVKKGKIQSTSSDEDMKALQIALNDKSFM